MSIEKELMQFRAGAPEEVIERMEAIVRTADGSKWVNFQPWVDEQDMPRTSIFKHLFSGRGFVVPTGTWVPGHAGSKRANVTEIGMTHPAGHDALGQLKEEGVTVPDGWVPIQDHTKRGLVIELPAGAAAGSIIEWIIQAATVLAGDLAVDDRWVAGFFTHE